MRAGSEGMKSVEDMASGRVAGAGSITGALWKPASAEPGCRQLVQWLQELQEVWRVWS
jgi:hypothetical protein